MSDRLAIREVALECRLGVADWERQRPQTIWVDLELAVDAARAAHDEVAATVDYARLVESLRRLVQRRAYRLMETLAEAIASLVLEECATPLVLVRLRKRALPGIGYAEVELRRRRRVGRAGAAARRRSVRAGAGA